MNHSALSKKVVLLFYVVLTLFLSSQSYSQHVRKFHVGFSALDIEVSASNPNILYACYRNGIKRSDDGGETWSAVNGELIYHDIEIDPSNPDVIYALGYAYNMVDYLLVSEDGGMTWKERAADDIGIYFVEVSPHPPYPIYADLDSFAVSYDHGRTWSRIQADIPRWSTSLDFIEGEPSTVYIGAYKRGVWVSRDNWATWDSLGLGGYEYYTNSSEPEYGPYSADILVSVNPLHPDIIYAAAVGYDLFKTINGGESWRVLSSGITGKWFSGLVLNKRNPLQLFVATVDSGLFVSANAGATWQRVEGIPRKVAALAFDRQNGKLFASIFDDPCIYVINIDSLFTSVQDERSTEPHNFRLNQNYPNPFNSETWIQYTVPSPGSIRLDIYDISGRTIRTLLHGRQSPGTHRVKWDGRDDSGRELSSGLYVYQMRAGGKSITRKLLLVR